MRCAHPLAWPRCSASPARYFTLLRLFAPPGFSLGSSVRAHTKGIWMWCVPHPCKPGHTLVLLDTEGLGDTEKVGEKRGLPSCLGFPGLVPSRKEPLLEPELNPWGRKPGE